MATAHRTIWANVIEVQDAAFSGTGAYILGGAANGRKRFQDIFSTGAKITYTVVPQDPTDTRYERNRGGVLGSATSLGRNVVASSNSDSAVNWAADDELYIFCDSGADLLSDMREGEFGSAIPSDLPRGGSYMKDLGSNVWQRMLFDGTDQVGHPYQFDVAANIAYLLATGLTHKMTLSDNGAAAGPNAILDRLSADPAVNDIVAQLLFRARNASAAEKDYGKIVAYLLGVTGGAESGGFDFNTLVAGADTLQMMIRAGVAIGNPTGATLGAGSLNVAGELRMNNQLISDSTGHLMPRSYTVGTLPTATARRVIYVSDGASNKRLAVGDGAAFRYPDGVAV
jgi:hypothetical protein